MVVTGPSGTHLRLGYSQNMARPLLLILLQTAALQKFISFGVHLKCLPTSALCLTVATDFVACMPFQVAMYMTGLGWLALVCSAWC